MQELAKAHASVPSDRRADAHAARAAAAGRPRHGTFNSCCQQRPGAVGALLDPAVLPACASIRSRRATLHDEDLSVDFAAAHHAARPRRRRRHRAADAATKPGSAFGAGELRVFVGGASARRRRPERAAAVCRGALAGGAGCPLTCRHAHAPTCRAARSPLRPLLPPRRADPPAARLRRGAARPGAAASRSARATRAATSGSRRSPTAPPAPPPTSRRSGSTATSTPPSSPPSTACLYYLHQLRDAATAATPTITQLLDTRAVYLCPRLNPDGAELALADRPRHIRSSTRPYPFDEAPVDGLTIEDVDGDGRVLFMRIPDPHGAYKKCHRRPAADGGARAGRVRRRVLPPDARGHAEATTTA